MSVTGCELHCGDYLFVCLFLFCTACYVLCICIFHCISHLFNCSLAILLVYLAIQLSELQICLNEVELRPVTFMRNATFNENGLLWVNVYVCCVLTER